MEPTVFILYLWFKGAQVRAAYHATIGLRIVAIDRVFKAAIRKKFYPA